ncbi:MAG: S24/S26 family peptidase [Alistipes sp.]|nr:S24/S26 family peptidase [Alistipes sp.]
MKVIPNKIYFEELERTLTAGKSAVVTIRGNSMMPLLRDGKDAVEVVSHTPPRLVVGQVVFFQYGEGWVMHRIAQIDGERVIFAGDGNLGRVEKALRKDVKADVVAIIRPSGFRIACDSWRWQIPSKLWLMLPHFVQRCYLAVLRRI